MGDPQPEDPAALARADPRLDQLMREIARTRDSLRSELDLRSPSPYAVIEARRAALAALENFAGALAARTLPLPRQVHADIQLLRALCGPVLSTPGRRARLGGGHPSP